MSKALSRQFRDQDVDAREMARLAARRSGQSLGDWLDAAIREKAEDERDDLLQVMEAVAQRSEDSERRAAHALNDIAGILEKSRRDQLTAETGYAALAERLGRLEGQFGASRIDAAPERVRETAAAATRGMAEAIAEITRRQRGLEAQEEHVQAAPAPRAVDDEIDEEIDALRADVDGVSRVLDDLAPRASLTAMESALEELARRVDAQRDRGVAEPLLAPAERIAGELRAVVADLDPTPIVRNLHADVTTIGARLDALRDGQEADADLLRDLSRDTREIKEQLAALTATPLPLEKIETRILGLARSVDSLTQSSGAAVADMSQLIAAIREIVRVETDRGFDAFNNRLEKLADKFDAALIAFDSTRFDELGARIAALGETLAQHIDRGLAQPSRDAAPLEALIATLAEKIDSALERSDEASGFAQISDRIERLETRFVDAASAESVARIEAMLAKPVNNGRDSELAQRIAARQDELAKLIELLAERMKNALDPAAGAQALKALERQIGELSQRLDRNDANGAALAAIEKKIGSLVAQIEETRTRTSQAAEEAVRRATAEIIRETAALNPAALREMVEREISDLRKVQDESGRRTRDALTAVHETLERVVGQLTNFEGELGALRVPAPESKIEAKKRQAATRGHIPTSDQEDVMDFLLPPGAAQQSAVASVIGGGDARSVQSDFIAAARRAAHQAARVAPANPAPAGPAPASPAPRAAASESREDLSAMLASLNAKIQARKRPLLLGLGVIALLMGAYQITRFGMQEFGAGVEVARHEAAAPAAKLAASTPRVVLPPTAAPAAQSAASLSAMIDPTPVGSIGNSAPAAPAAQTPPMSVVDETAMIATLAAQGDAVAQYELGQRYLDARGVARDPKTASQWLEKAAEQGIAPAQYRLGALYEKGVGVDRDLPRARKNYLAAAMSGNARAMHNLAVMLAEGGDDRPDYGAASVWFRKAAEYGVRDSQFNLAILYARGLGVSRDLTQAYLWFSAAAAQGDADAVKKRDEVSARLDSKELAAAKALVENFHAKQPPAAANDAPAPKGGWQAVKTPATPDAKQELKPLAKPKAS